MGRKRDGSASVGDNPVPGANAGTNGTISSGAILAIKEGMSDPVLARPGTQNQCVTCHIVSDDGSTLFAPNTNTLMSRTTTATAPRTI